MILVLYRTRAEKSFGLAMYFVEAVIDLHHISAVWITALCVDIWDLIWWSLRCCRFSRYHYRYLRIRLWWRF